MFDIPIEWLTWVYGKWFVGHPVRGFICVSVPFCAAFLVALGFGWLRAVDKYNEKLPKVEAAASSSGPSRDTTAKPPDPVLPKPAAKEQHPHPKAPKVTPTQQSTFQNCAPGAKCEPLENSIIENEGEIKDLDVDGSHAYAAKGGRPRLLRIFRVEKLRVGA